MIHTGSVGNTHLWLLQASSAWYSVSICFSFVLSSDHLATRVLWIMDFFRPSKVHSLQSYDTLNSSLLFDKASVSSCYLIRIFFQGSVSYKSRTACLNKAPITEGHMSTGKTSLFTLSAGLVWVNRPQLSWQLTGQRHSALICSSLLTPDWMWPVNLFLITQQAS